MAARKVLGSLIVILIGIPILFAIIWAVGLIRATVSSDFLSELPTEIIAEIPDSLDGVYAAAADTDVHMDASARAWLLAAEKTGIPPRELLEKTGILGWMQGELSSSLRQVGDVLRGESSVRSVRIDMRPLKTALLHPEMDRFISSLIDNLPPCDEQGMKAWQDRIAGGSWEKDLPPCRPVDAALARDVVFAEKNREVGKIEDSVEIFEHVEPFPFYRLGISRGVTMMSYLLFLFPAIFILLGVWIANRTAAGRLRWSGISILAGSVPVFLMSFMLKRIGMWAMDGGLLSWNAPWHSEINSVMVDKFGWIPSKIFDALFSPVFATAAVVAVIGVVLIALSYTTRSAATPAKS